MKLLSKLTTLSLITTLGACSKKSSTNTNAKPTTSAVVLASWGEYFNADNIKMLEEKSGVKIKLIEYASNEVLYKGLKTNNYDLVIPSEYMADKLRNENQLQKINLEDYKLTKSKFLPSVTNAFDKYKNGALWSYTLPLVVGDIRVHINPRVLSKVSSAVDGNYINLNELIKIKDIKIGIQEDARNVTWLAMNYYYGSKVTPIQANNPTLEQADIALKNFFTNNKKFIFGDETIIPEKWVAGEVDVLIGYNTDPNWSLKDSKNYPTVDKGFGQNREYKSYKILNNSNLWIDAIGLTKDAKADSKKVLKAIFENYDSLALTTAYNPTLDSTNQKIANNYQGQELINYILDKNENYYSPYITNKDGDINYNDKIAKLYAKYRS